MSMSFEEYTKQKFDKKKKKTEDSFEEYTRQKFGDSSRRRSLLDDIVPVRKDIAPASKKSISAPTWFQKSEYFKDGTWDKGDLFKTIFGSATDVGENATAGAMGGGEKFLDALAMIGNALYGSQMSQAAENEMIFNTLAGKSNENTLKNYTDFQKQATKGTEEFVKKDLYDEEAIAKKIISAPIKKKTGIDAETASVFGEKSDAVAQSAGQLAATKALSLVGVPWFLTTGGTAFGGQAEQALNEGATYEQAMMSATVSAGAEVLSEKLTGGIKFGSKTLDEAVTKPLIETISNKAVQKLVNVGVDAVGEGSEEVISSFFSRLGTALYKEEDLSEILASEDAFNEYLDGFIGGAFLGGASSTGKAVKGKVKGFDPVSELTDNEQKVVDKIVSDRITEKTKDGNKLTTRDKIKIREAVKTDMEKGRIDIDTLESILGGEAYNNYKSVAEKEEALQNEFNTLNKMKQGDMTGEQLDRRAELKQQLEELKSKSKKTELKDKLSKDVFALAKDSRLVESYNEKARRGKAFEADLSKYDAAQQETIKKAVDSGILNNTNRTHEFVDMLAKISADKGVLFDFTSNEKLKNSSFALEGKTVNGYVTGDGNVAVNVDSSKSLNTVVGHEITHILEGTELYDALHQSIVEYAKAKGDYDGRYKTIEKLYEGIEGADINKELTADLVGDYLFTDENFIRNLSTEQPGVFKKVYDEIKYLCKVATAGSKEARELEKIKKTFSDIYRDSGKAQKNTTEEGGGDVKYSLSTDAKTELHKALYDMNYRNEVLLRDETPSIMLSQKGVQNRKMVMNASHIRENVFTADEARALGLKVNDDTHYHGIGEENFLKMIDSLDNVKEAYRGTKYADMPSRREKYFLLVTEFKDSNGNTVNVPVYIEEGAICNRVYLKSNKIATVFGRDDFREYINKQIKNKNLVRIKNKNSTISEGGVPLTPAYENTALENNISQNPEKSSGNTSHSLSLEDVQAVKHGDYHITGEDVRFAPVREDIAEKSQNKAQKEQILSNEPPIREDIAKNATTTPKSMYVTPIEEINVPSGDDITDEPVSITTVKERLEANLQNATTELENNKKHREESIERINTKIADYQAMYESKKNKDTQVANNLLRSIERLKNNRDNINAQYDKRINDIEKRIDKLNGQLQQDHSKEDNLERALKRIDTRLEREKQELIDAFNLKKGNIEETTADKDAFVSKKAYELYRELWNLKKGVRASQELSAMLDYGPDWGELKRSLLHIKASPSQRVDEDSSIESIAREIITTAYEDELYSVDESYAELKKQLDELDADAEKARQRAREDNELVKRKELHESKINNIKARFSEKGFDFDEVLREAKNLFAFSTVDNTPQRVMEKALGYKQGQILADATVNKVAQNETEGIKWLNSFLDKKSGLLVQIAKEHNIKPGSKESAAAQMYAEGFYVDKNKEIIKYSDNELAIDFPDKTVRRNIKALAGDTRIRQIYDETLEAINEARVRNGYPEIPRLDNYFLHYRAMEDTFSQIGLPFNPNVINAKDLPTDLNGVTADLKPGKPYFASEKHRTGMRTTFDLLGGLERYLSSAKNQIYHIDDIQTLRALRNYIADSFGQAKGLESLDTLSEEAAQEHIEKVYNSHLSTFAKFLNEEANVIAGKTALIDRAVEGIAERKGITFLDTVNKQVGSNFVGFNVSSAATNAVSVVQTIAKTQKYDCLKAFAQMASNKINSLYGKSDGFAETNPGIIRRKGADKFAKTPYEKVADAGYILASAIDNVSTEFIVRTKFNEFTRKGMSEEQAHIEADKWASRLLGDRSIGQQPQLYNSKMLGLFTKFQLEVRNQLDSMFYDTIQEAKASTEDIENARVRNAKTAAKVTSTFLQLAILQHIFGKGFEAVAGYNPAFDIIDVLIKTLGFDDDEDDEDTALDNIEQGFLALLEDLPYTSTLTGGRVPIANALPVKELITGKDDYGTDKPRGETIKEALPYYLLPGGYGQLKKTAQGINMFNKDLPISGSYTDSGNLRFPVDDTIKNRAQAFLFGQYASENAREYFDEGHAPLKEKQIQEFIDIDVPIADYWKYRKGLKGLETTEDKFDYVNSLDLPLSKKNILINNLVDRKEPVDLENYSDFSSLEEFDFWVENPEKHAVSKVTGGYDSYKTYTKALSYIEADKDNFGKPISGSKKQKVAKYISGLDADYYTKIILFKSEYNSDHRYDYEIVTHLNSRNDLTYEEKVDILTELGFTVGADGNIGWE